MIKSLLGTKDTCSQQREITLIPIQNPNVCRGKELEGRREEGGGRRERGGGRSLTSPCVRMDSVLNHLSSQIHMWMSVCSGVKSQAAGPEIKSCQCITMCFDWAGQKTGLSCAASILFKGLHYYGEDGNTHCPMYSVVLVMDFKNASESI